MKPPKHYHVRPGNTWGVFLKIKATLEKRNPDTVINDAYVIRFALRFTAKGLGLVEDDELRAQVARGKDVQS